MTDWLEVSRGDAPLVIAFPHTGTDLRDEVEPAFVSPWLARKDTDWWVDSLYAFAKSLDVTLVRTRISRSIIDVNRDPWGGPLYPGQATTALCPLTSFDGEPLYVGGEPDAEEIARRRSLFFDPYHAALHAELDRLRHRHERVVLYDAHSIRSRIPRLFEGELPHLNIGTNGGETCDPSLTAAVVAACSASGFSHVVDGRFKGGWTTRHYGRPATRVHAIQMELAMRAYMVEPSTPAPTNWPGPFDADRAAPLADVLRLVLGACLSFAGVETTP